MMATSADGRGDRAVEVGEPVVGQRLAGEVRHLRREVAVDDAVADRDVDEEVAPVPATGDEASPSVSRQPLPPRTTRTTRPTTAADRSRPARSSREHAPRSRPGTSRRGAATRRAPATDGRTRRRRRRRRTSTGRRDEDGHADRSRRRRRRRSTRWAARYTLVTTPTPTTPGRGRSGATRRTMTQPGTANSHGQTSSMAMAARPGGRSHVRATMAPISADGSRATGAVVGGGLHGGR